MSRTHKSSGIVNATIAAGTALSGPIDMRAYSSLAVIMPATWTAASIGFQVSATSTGTFQPLRDDDGALVQIDSPVADNTYNAPVGSMVAGYVKLWSQDGSGNNTNQASARTLGVMMKS